MPPKKLSNVKSIHSMTSSTDSRNRMNMVNDLITQSQQALSSQATVYQQRTQSTQNTHLGTLGTDYGQNDGGEYNRDQIEQVFITKEQEQIIQKILQLSRKGKVNTTNAFEIPIKVLHSQNTSSINNKFWKFSSQLLSASMGIYDKRVENMYASTNAFQNKLMRVGFKIKQKDQNRMNSQEDFDNVENDQERRRVQQKRQRQQILSISLQDFSGALNLQDHSTLGAQTLQRKQKIDIKRMQNEFIADPTFLRTQKMFDSFSVKSLMLNIFSFSNNLDVRIFYKSDLEMQKYTNNNSIENLQRSEQNNQNNNENHNENQMNQNNGQQEQDIRTQTLSKNVSNDQFGNSSLPYKYQKHLQQIKKISYQHQLFKQITDFKIQQFELVKDYQNRNPADYEQMQQQLRSQSKQSRHSQFGSSQKSQDFEFDKKNEPTFKQIIQKEMTQFITLMKQIDHNFDENQGRHRFDSIQNGQGLFETHQTQSQPYQPFQNNGDNFSDSHNNPLSLNEFSQTNTVPISLHETSFFAWDQGHNVMQPIMPHQIEVKNLKLIKKAKKRSKKIPQSNALKKSLKNKNLQFKIQFDLQFIDKSKSLLSTQAKTQFQKSIEVKPRKTPIIEKNLLSKTFDYVYSQYHQKNSISFKNFSRSMNESYKDNGQQKQNKRNNSFALDIDHNNFDQKKNYGFQDSQQTQMNQPYYGQHESGLNIEVSKMSQNTAYFGNLAGVKNIRETKQYIKRILNQKGFTDMQQVQYLLGQLSVQQIFTIFLHLTNQMQLLITNNEDETNPRLQLPTRQNKNMAHRQNRMHERSIFYADNDDVQI